MTDEEIITAFRKLQTARDKKMANSAAWEEMKLRHNQEMRELRAQGDEASGELIEAENALGIKY